jgi:hypothetical protein
MDWTLPDIPILDCHSVESPNENALTVVYCCWRAAERHQNNGEIGRAISLLAKLNCSKFVSFSPHLEIGSRIRLAALCCTIPGLVELAMEQLNRVVCQNLKFDG